jgi:hypothetical protein
MRSSIFPGGANVLVSQQQIRLALQHRPRIYLRLGFVPTGEMEMSARLNLIPGTQT